MKASRIALASFALGLAVGSGATCFAKEDAAANLGKAPAAVQATVKKELGKRMLEEFDKEIAGGKLEYEAGYAENGVDHAVIIDATGKVIQREADIEIDKLPPAVAEAIKKAHPDGKVTEAATASSAQVKEFYDVDVKVGTNTHSMDVKADGTLFSDEVVVPGTDEAKPAGATTSPN
jgi:alpha-tubulin suppressor-like RCC1 family protein